MLSRLLVPLALFFLGSASAVTPPVPIDTTALVQLVAMEPEIRTPTAVAADPRGRIWVLENNTHFRPKTYDAPPTDRIVILDDFGPDGRARKHATFLEGFRDGMGLHLLPDGAALVSTRSECFTARDRDGDGIAETRTTVLRLETEGNYPHNGLSGIALDGEGRLYLGLGENFGKPWTLTGPDGRSVKGADEGGIFRCRIDGSELEPWAKGFWNPFGLAFDQAGRLFALDNDPGGGSLCRLLFIVRNGDYGFRYRYGRTTSHPFLSWHGQLPGTLPPVCLVGEAPVGLIMPRTGAFAGRLLGCSWSDHGVQHYPLEGAGTRLTSKPAWILRGTPNFRPSGIAEAPDGSLVIADWVDRSYEVHGKGRIWRLRGAVQAKPRAEDRPLEVEDTKTFEAPDAALFLADDDPFAVHAAIEKLREHPSLLNDSGLLAHTDPRVRVGLLLASRRSGLEPGAGQWERWLGDDSTLVRRAALQWISEEGVTSVADKLPLALARAPLAGQPTRATFLAYLAASQFLASGKPDPKATIEQTRTIALDASQPAELRALALRLLPADGPGLTLFDLRSLAALSSSEVRVEALRILAARTGTPNQAELLRIAGDAATPAFLAAEALAGLAPSAADVPARALLEQALLSPEAAVVQAARRSLAQPSPTIGLPAGAGDPAAGRRLFFHPNGPQCATCHQVEGRGGQVGPDLTDMTRFTPEQIVEAIRDPSKEVGPTYAQWRMAMRDGTEHFGINLYEDNKDALSLVGSTGVRTKITVADIVERQELPTSLMPPGLDQTMSAQEMADLIAYLREPRE